MSAVEKVRASRARQWRLFCRKALGSDPSKPLQGVAGATITALSAAFRECYPRPESKKLPELPDFGAEIFNSPWTVYAIRNDATQEVYIGTARKGFVSRYKNGAWWKEHHNARLARDALMFGVRHFRIAIHVCSDDADMNRVEAMLLRMHRPATYNDRPEPDNVRVAADGDDE